MVVERLLIGALSSLSTAIITYVITRSKTSLKKISINNAATMALLSHHLVEIYIQAEAQDATTIMDRQSFDLMYKNYQNLGGNGFIDDVKRRYDAIRILEVRV